MARIGYYSKYWRTSPPMPRLVYSLESLERAGILLRPSFSPDLPAESRAASASLCGSLLEYVMSAAFFLHPARTSLFGLPRPSARRAALCHAFHCPMLATAHMHHQMTNHHTHAPVSTHDTLASLRVVLSQFECSYSTCAHLVTASHEEHKAHKGPFDDQRTPERQHPVNGK